MFNMLYSVYISRYKSKKGIYGDTSFFLRCFYFCFERRDLIVFQNSCEELISFSENVTHAHLCTRTSLHKCAHTHTTHTLTHVHTQVRSVHTAPRLPVEGHSAQLSHPLLSGTANGSQTNMSLNHHFQLCLNVQLQTL